jgi:membrane protease YdiL (CAAX protease family)
MEEEKRTAQNPKEFNYTEFEQPPLLPWIERNGFSHWAVAFGWLFVGLIAFQVLGGIISVILIIPTLENFSDAQVVIEALTQNINAQLQANSVSQFLIIGLASYLISKAHAVKGKHHEFLRLQLAPNLVQNTLVAILLLVSSWGVVGLLGWLNLNFFEWLVSIFPALSFFQDLQEQMLEIITGFIKSENAMFLGLIYIALVPAIFEEVMFRGYIQRALEKSWGIWAAIIVSAFMFGAYHLQPANLLPLSFLGFIFAYVTYISNSLIPAMILHFINNGSQVVYGSLNPEFLEQASSADIPLPWFMIILSVIVTTALLLLMHKMKMKSEAGHV